MNLFDWLSVRRATETQIENLQCVFCKKPGAKVKSMVAVSDEDGTGVCDGCIALLCDIMAEKDDVWRKRQIKSLMKRGSGPI